MLDDILSNENVSKLIKEVVNNNRYNKKEDANYLEFIDNEQALFILIDALYKYRMIINDKYLFNDFVVQLNLVFRKITNFDDITNGINKLITKFTIIKLGYKEKEEEHRDEIIKYVYDKYITDGYLFHSINDVYIKDIIENGFIPQKYNNLYDKFIKLQGMLKDDVISKDFTLKSISFTDSFEKAYFYASHSPLYFYGLLCDNDLIKKEEDKKAYLFNDYEGCLKNINKIISRLELNDEKAKYLRNVFNEEWKLINKSNSGPTIMAIKRNLILKEDINLDKIINDKNIKLVDAISKIIDSRHESINYEDKIDAKDILFIRLPSYKSFVIERKIVKEEVPKKEVKIESNNNYGKASILMIVGSILITLGVIITIIMTMIGG